MGDAMGKDAEDMLVMIAEAEADIVKTEKKLADFIVKRDKDRVEMKTEIAANKKEAEEKEAAAVKGLEEGKKKTLWLEVGDMQGTIATKLERGKAWDSKYKLF